MTGDDSARIIEIRLDAASIVRWSREVEHERQVAVFDLLERNSFRLVNGFAGPYRVLRSSVPQATTLKGETRGWLTLPYEID